MANTSLTGPLIGLGLGLGSLSVYDYAQLGKSSFRELS
jgi:hypothetical protein